MFLNDIKTFEFQAGKKYVFLISLGALEQHGPFAPLGTDNIIQDELIRKVEAGVPDVVFLPTIPIGESELQLGFAGSVSFSGTTLYLMIDDIIRCLVDYASMIILVSWHGGNKPVIDKFIKEKQAHYNTIKLVQRSFGDEATDIEAEELIPGGLDDHAGNMEVSMSLSVRPDITEQPASDTRKTTLTFGWDKPVLFVATDGVVDSNPKWIVSKEIGVRLYEIFANNLIKKIQILKSDLDIDIPG